MKKIKVGVFFGGRSTEHEVTIWSAKSVVANLNPDKYEVLLIGIDKSGKFHFGKDEILKYIPQAEVLFAEDKFCKKFPSEMNEYLSEYIDVAFPVLHGYLGEDGAIQGFLKILNIPFVGPDILSSAACMDKEITKILLRSEGLPVADYMTLRKPEVPRYEYVTAKLGEVVFVKPASSGSSVGVSKVRNESELLAAVTEAYRYDNKVLIERAVQGREIECAVIGNENPKTSDVCGEIIALDDFYTYEAKYIDENGAKLEIPAKLSPETLEKAKSTALKAYKTLNCEGMCRVDMFVSGNNIIVNEMNTIPGFVGGTSMYPLLLQKSGLSYSELIDKLLELAIARHQRDAKLKTSKGD
ncbi:MAG: D-alanine--D-alanine ligase [Alphaproteobacteria bacterium]|nr:D-alanine--D-alanine ligase [Alphaproteobacteria bacterium]